MDKDNEDKKKEKKNIDKKEKVKEMRERLAKNMGTSNYFFYLESNINSRVTRGI